MGRDKLWNDVIKEIIIAILEAWPLVLLNILIMIVAGFIVWLLVRVHVTQYCFILRN